MVDIIDAGVNAAHATRRQAGKAVAAARSTVRNDADSVRRRFRRGGTKGGKDTHRVPKRTVGMIASAVGTVAAYVLSRVVRRRSRKRDD